MSSQSRPQVFCIGRWAMSYSGFFYWIWGEKETGVNSAVFIADALVINLLYYGEKSQTKSRIGSRSGPIGGGGQQTWTVLCTWPGIGWMTAFRFPTINHTCITSHWRNLQQFWKKMIRKTKIWLLVNADNKNLISQFLTKNPQQSFALDQVTKAPLPTPMLPAHQKQKPGNWNRLWKKKIWRVKWGIPSSLENVQ